MHHSSDFMDMLQYLISCRIIIIIIINIIIVCMDDNANAKRILLSVNLPSGRLEKTTRSSLRHMA